VQTLLTGDISLLPQNDAENEDQHNDEDDDDDDDGDGAAAAAAKKAALFGSARSDAVVYALSTVGGAVGGAEVGLCTLNQVDP
jgi:hypothetical protein